MPSIEVNGRKIIIEPTRSRFKKTAHVIKQEIIHSLGRIGVTSDFIDLEIPRNPLKYGAPAQISWVINSEDFFYECNVQERYVDNLGVIAKVINQEMYAILNGLKSLGMVLNQFRLGHDESGTKTKTPREIIGVPADIKDFEYIKYKYKSKAKELHPDAGGNAEDFKQLNEAFTSIKKELEN